MILTDGEIMSEIEAGSIVISPFDENCLGTNSYDVHLSKNLAVYIDRQLDAKAHNQLFHFEIPESGYVLQPGELYLGVTEEYTETLDHIPFLEGKSSTGRLGINIHATAGKGDVGFCNYWTLEISVIKPVKVYAGMPIAQLIYFECNNEHITTRYHEKPSAKYNAVSNRPTESMMWKGLINPSSEDG